jgi:hypothetical protein
MLRKHGIAFSEHPYDYEEHGGTTVSARELGVDEHAVRVSFYSMDSNESPMLMGLRCKSSESIGGEVFNGQFGSFCPRIVARNRPKKSQRYWGR